MLVCHHQAFICRCYRRLSSSGFVSNLHDLMSQQTLLSTALPVSPDADRLHGKSFSDKQPTLRARACAWLHYRGAADALFLHLNTGAF